jgi:hypothetical protein
MFNHNEGKVKLGLFGFWKIYQLMYQNKGWSLEMVCSFMEG